MAKKIIITIDGWSSCGKSTLAKQLAEKLGYVYVDSGAMYRAVGLAVTTSGVTTIAATTIAATGSEAIGIATTGSVTTTVAVTAVAGT